MECKHVPIYRLPKGRKEIFSTPHPVPSSSYSGVSPHAGFPPFPSPNGLFLLFLFFRPRYGEKETMRWHLAWAIPPFPVTGCPVFPVFLFICLFMGNDIRAPPLRFPNPIQRCISFDERSGRDSAGEGGNGGMCVSALFICILVALLPFFRNVLRLAFSRLRTREI